MYEQFSNILRNHLKRHRPTSMIELSQHHNGSKEKLDWRMTAGACQRMRQMSFFVFRKSNVSKSKNRKTFRLQRPLGDRTNLHKLKHLDRAITRWRSHDPSVSGVRKLFERYKEWKQFELLEKVRSMNSSQNVSPYSVCFSFFLNHDGKRHRSQN